MATIGGRCAGTASFDERGLSNLLQSPPFPITLCQEVPVSLEHHSLYRFSYISNKRNMNLHVLYKVGKIKKQEGRVCVSR